MRNKLLFFSVVIYFGSHFGLLSAKETELKPDWVLNKQKNDTVFSYYVGRASNVASESDGFAAAYKDALQQAAKENYGVTVSSESQKYSTNENTMFVDRTAEVSKKVEINSFELVVYHIEKLKQDRINFWALYKYPTSEIQKEKKRLSELKTQSKTPSFADAGDLGISARKSVEIVTSAIGADVYIDGRLLSAETPLKVRLSSGVHSIQIDHKNYETITEKIIAVDQKTQRLNYILKPSFGYLNIDTTPAGARVFRNGEPVGMTPLSKVKVRSGEQQIIQIEHPETEKYAQTLLMQKDEIKNINVSLPLKSATLFITTEPLGAEVSIDGQAVGVTPIKPITMDAGEHRLSFTKQDHEEETVSVKLKGNENHILDTVKLYRSPQVSVKSEPSGADVYIDGTSIGNTPVLDVQIPNSGRHEVRITKTGYQDHETYVKIEKGTNPETLEVTLDEIPTWEFRPWDVIIGLGKQFKIMDTVPDGVGYYMSSGLDFRLAVEKRWSGFFGTRVGSVVTFGSGGGFKRWAFEYYVAVPMYLHYFTASVNNYLAFSPLIGHQPYCNISFIDKAGYYSVYQYFYGIELEYRYFWDIEDQKLGFGLMAGYKKYSKGLGVMISALSMAWRF